MPNNKKLDSRMYLGDKVYVTTIETGILLYTEINGSNGLTYKNNAIFLGRNELSALDLYLKSRNLIGNQRMSINPCGNCEGMGQIGEFRKCVICNGSGKNV